MTEAPEKKRRASGRPTGLTPAVQTQICGYVNGGAPVPRACEAASVSWSTAKDWLAKGKLGRQPYADFVQAIAEAKAKWECASAMRITAHGKKDWKAAAWMLERRSPAWAPPKTQHEFNVQVHTHIRALLEQLRTRLPTTFSFDELLTALAEQEGKAA